jgi:hypothetical protein
MDSTKSSASSNNTEILFATEPLTTRSTNYTRPLKSNVQTDVYATPSAI